MFKPRDKQTTFFDATYFCEKLIPEDSFYRKFPEIVWPIIDADSLTSCTKIAINLSSQQKD
jgi:hypothetical protein